MTFLRVTKKIQSLKVQAIQKTIKIILIFFASAPRIIEYRIESDDIRKIAPISYVKHNSLSSLIYNRMPNNGLGHKPMVKALAVRILYCCLREYNLLPCTSNIGHRWLFHLVRLLDQRPTQ